jgi:hypothetical protein
MRSTVAYSTLAVSFLVALATFSSNGFNGRSLLSSSSSSSSTHSYSDLTSSDFKVEEEHTFSGKCNAQTRVLQMIKAYNEARFEDYASFFTEDSLRFVNGQLDIATQGRPLEVEDLYALREQYPVRIDPHSITKAGDWAIAVSGHFIIGGDIAPAQAAGLGIVYEFRHEDRCLIQVERLYYGQESEAYNTYLGAVCQIYPELELRGMCSGVVAPPTGEPSFDYLGHLRTCWEHVANSDSVGIAGCFSPTATMTANGVAVPQARPGTVGYWNNIFSYVEYKNIVVSSATVTGTTTYALITGRLADKTGKLAEIPFQIFQILEGNQGGEYLAEHFTMNGAADDFYAIVSGSRNIFDQWTSSSAVDAANAAIEVFGQPGTLVNDGENNKAVWHSSDLLAFPFNRVTAVDEAIQHAEHGEVSDNSLICKYTIAIADGKVEEVRSIAKSIIYDSLTDTLTSWGYSPGKCMVDAYYVKRVAAGITTVEQAQAEYASSLAQIANTEGAFFQEVLDYLS